MANGVWHRGREIEINLSREDLGHPAIEGLLEEITTSVSDRDPTMLECLEHHENRRCRSARGGKTEWMFVRRMRVDGQVRLVAAHLPVTHRATPEESDRHSATKERIAAAAVAGGLDAEVEARIDDGHGVLDALVTGPAGIRVGWEVQYAPVSAATVRKRSETAYRHGATPSWVTHDDTSQVIHRAPWSLVNDMSWQDIANGREMLIRGGIRHLQTWTCSPSSDRPCPDGQGSCGEPHFEWFAPADCIPEKRYVTIDELVVSSAYGQHVPLFRRRRGNGRSGFYTWVAPQERHAWFEMQELPEQDDEDADEADEITYTEDEIDRSCRWGDEGPVRGGARPRRDVPAPGHRVPPQRNSLAEEGRFRVTDRQRRAAALLHDCRTWEIGPCFGCSTLMHRYGRHAGMYCAGCRSKIRRA